MSKNPSGFVAQPADSALRAGRLSFDCDTLADEHNKRVDRPFSYLRGARSLRARARRCQLDVDGLCKELEAKARLPLLHSHVRFSPRIYRFAILARSAHRQTLGLHRIPAPASATGSRRC
jgi:hypothetical protein